MVALAQVEDLLSRVDEWIAQPWARPALVVVISLIAAFFVEKVVSRLLLAAAAKTSTDLDDQIIKALRRPVFLSVILFGLSLVTRELKLDPHPTALTISALQTFAVLVWAGALFRVSHEVLQFLSLRANGQGVLQNRTVPIFDIVLKAAVLGGAVYFFFLAWDIDVTAWLASAGIVGIAVGFAAKDTLANLFSGLFIIADAPYKVGDFIVIDGTLNGRPLRGEVTRIGMRSTRMFTRDDLEITIPNAVIGNSKIINESGGPHPKQRARVRVGVSYGSDPEKVREVLLTCTDGIDGVCKTPAPQIRFRDFGDSSLDFELLFWTDRPKTRGIIESDINFRIFERFKQESIEIPFPQRDLWV
ncbi:MAG: mechanosensitive ion channel, partial [Deltaproteobacteria bacterium]|nr:mechanosensitive ion channel [Deltaproteobacteria bacterium]